MNKVKVGDVMNLAYGKFDFGFNEDTRVVEIKKNGTIVLACGMKFHANGEGHAANAAINVRRLPICHWNDSRPEFKLSPAARNAAIAANQDWMKTVSQEEIRAKNDSAFKHREHDWFN